MDVPLVQRAAGGTGILNAQGPPFWIGRTNSRGMARSPVGSIGAPADVTSPTKGAENFLEVRWSMEDAVVGLSGLALAQDAFVLSVRRTEC